MPKKVQLRMRAYGIVEGAIEPAIRYGIHRAYKHSEKSLTDQEIESLVSEIENAIMNELSELIDWDRSG